MSATPVAVRLGEPLKERVRALADHKNRPMHWLMREAIEQYVTREVQRESFRQETLDAWRAFQETGLHVTGDEAVAWLSSWGEENELPAPEPHTRTAHLMRVQFAPPALLDLELLRDFLRPKNPAAAKRAAVAIVNPIKILERHPQIGRPVEGMDDLAFCELLIDFGDSGYVARYRLAEDSVTVLVVRQQ